MRARISKDGHYYFGEVYGSWCYKFYGIQIPLNEWEGWKKVTRKCLTVWQAKEELKKWKDKNFPDEFEI